MSIERIALTRACTATEIPNGYPRLLAAGTRVSIMQSLGGSHTVSDEFGQLMRVDAKDADALGMVVPEHSESPQVFSEQLVWNQLRTVYDPEIPVNLVDLGLIYSCVVNGEDNHHQIDIKMSMTAPGCGMGNVLRSDIERKLSGLPTVSGVHVEVVFDPPWNPGLMSEAARLQLGLD
ncbi:MAG TPA: putative Fe-S cluster assembly protein SufT [Acidisarcina sp.]|nr:putative Fe-S cluster assembly protein SufT [Acidisarcina sp.]